MKDIGGIRQWREQERRAGFWRWSQVGIVQEISHVKSQNKYIILNHWSSEGKRELNMQVDVKTKNGKKLKVKALVDSEWTHTGIDKQLVKDKRIKDKRIQTKPINFSFEVFNADGMENGEVIRVVLQLKDLSVSQWEEPCIGLHNRTQ